MDEITSTLRKSSYLVLELIADNTLVGNTPLEASPLNAHALDVIIRVWQNMHPENLPFPGHLHWM